MKHLTMRAWVHLAGGDSEAIDKNILTPLWPSWRALCTGEVLPMRTYIAYIGALSVHEELPTCPECSMLRESLLLALEVEASKP